MAASGGVGRGHGGARHWVAALFVAAEVSGCGDGRCMGRRRPWTHGHGGATEFVPGWRGTRLRGRKLEEIGEVGPTTDGSGSPAGVGLCRRGRSPGCQGGKSDGTGIRGSGGGWTPELAEVVLAKEAGGSARNHPTTGT
ncbi:hypothetical protein ACQJBY_064190 [Aegilops geniculata]